MVGIGEIAPGSLGCPRERPTREQRFKEWCAIAELATHYDVPVYFHGMMETITLTTRIRPRSS